MPINDDPFAPWNNPMYQDDPFAAHNNPMESDNPFKPWNEPFGSVAAMRGHKTITNNFAC